MNASSSNAKKVKVVDVMVHAGLAKSKTEAKNLIKQGAVTLYTITIKEKKE